MSTGKKGSRVTDKSLLARQLTSIDSLAIQHGLTNSQTDQLASYTP